MPGCDNALDLGRRRRHRQARQHAHLNFASLQIVERDETRLPDRQSGKLEFYKGTGCMLEPARPVGEASRRIERANDPAWTQIRHPFAEAQRGDCLLAAPNSERIV